jgi:hypothetical protein
MVLKKIPIEMLLVMGYYYYYYHSIIDDLWADYEVLFEVVRMDDGMNMVRWTEVMILW